MTHIEQRMGPAAEWTTVNPVLNHGEAGHESDTGKWKLGDGVTAWTALPYKAGVNSVAGKTGTVALVVADVPDAAPLASPTFTGNPKGPTRATSDNSTSLATTAYVKAALATLIAGSPALLDTLDEIAAALNDDPNFAATMTTALATKAPLASPTFTGDPKAPTPAATDEDTSIATTAYVQNAMRLVRLEAVTSGNTVINDSATSLISFSSEVEDTNNAYAAGVFTCPVAGLYRVEVALAHESSTVGRRALLLYKNGAPYVPGILTANPVTADHTYMSLSIEMRLAVGNTISVYALQTSGSAKWVIAGARLAIRRVSN